MQFAQMSGGTRQAKEVLWLNGGLNTWEPPSLLDDRALSDCENVYWKRGALRTRPAVRVTADTADTAPIVATFETADGEYQCVRTAAHLLVYYKGTLILKEENIAHIAARQHAFFAEGKGGTVLMFLSWTYEEHEGREVWEITLDDENATLRKVEDMYEPTVFINGRGATDRVTAGTVTMAEGFNLLCNRYCGFWTTDGECTWFRPPFKAGRGRVTAEYTHTDGNVYTFAVLLSGADGLNGMVYSEAQTIPDMGEVCLCVGLLGGECAFCDPTTKTPVALPEVGFANNLLVRGVHTHEHADAVFSMSFSTWFGGASDGLGGGTRLFVGGHQTDRHIVRYSDVDEPLYFPENNFIYVGDPSQAVTAFGKQNSMLVVFKERELFGCEYAYKGVDETAFVNGETVDITATAYFPLSQLHAAVGCDLPHTVRLCGNRLVWAHSNGEVYTLSSLSAWSEKAVRCLSRTVAPSLRGKQAVAAALYHGHYLLLFGEEIYLFDYTDPSSAAWYRWRLPVPPRALLGCDDGMVLVIPTAQGLGIARFEDAACDRTLTGEVPIRARVTTKPYPLGRGGARGAVYALQLHLGCTGGAVDVTLQGDGTAVPHRLQTVWGDADDVIPVSVPCRQTRVHTLGITVESDDPLVLTGLLMEYRIWKGV